MNDDNFARLLTVTSWERGGAVDAGTLLLLLWRQYSPRAGWLAVTGAKLQD